MLVGFENISKIIEKNVNPKSFYRVLFEKNSCFIDLLVYRSTGVNSKVFRFSLF